MNVAEPVRDTFRTHGRARFGADRPNGGGRRRRAGRPTVRAVHPEVWATALALAGGNARRVVRVSDREVVVLNRPASRDDARRVRDTAA